MNTLKNISDLVRVPEIKILEIIGSLDKYYYKLELPKMKYGQPQLNKDKTIKLRKLNPSVGELKKIQSKLNYYIQKKIVIGDYAYGSIPGRNNILNAKVHSANKFFLTIDLKNFFSRITNKQVYNMFISNKFSPTAARILTQLTTYKGHLPQGAPTSPLIANLVFVKAATEILSYTSAYSITFTTFIDDLNFSSKFDFKFLIPQILEIIKSNSFFVNHMKISYRSFHVEVTGIRIIYNKLGLVDEMKKAARLDDRLKKYINQIRRQNL